MTGRSSTGCTYKESLGGGIYPLCGLQEYPGGIPRPCSSFLLHAGMRCLGLIMPPSLRSRREDSRPRYASQSLRSRTDDSRPRYASPLSLRSRTDDSRPRYASTSGAGLMTHRLVMPQPQEEEKGLIASLCLNLRRRRRDSSPRYASNLRKKRSNEAKSSHPWV